MTYVERAIQRFWTRVDPAGPSGCWVWTGGRDACGYSMFWYRGKNIHGSRFVWLMLNGPIPSEMVIRHRCDNPSCVNPDHLETGTQAENIADKVDRGRQAKGEGHGMSVLTLRQVRYIKAHYVKRHRIWNGANIARQLGVPKTAVADVVRGRTWGWV